MRSLSVLPLLFFFLTQAVALLGQSSAASAGDATVVMINDEPVSADEYKLVMDRQVARVYSHFKQTRDLDDCAGYWSASSGPEGPLAKLREMTLEELIRIKVYQSQAKARGLVKETRFARFRAAFEGENDRRLAAKAKGEVIYGPPQYRLTTYYFILLGDLVFKLEQAMSKELELTITQSEVDAFLEKHREEFAPLSPEDARQRAVVVLSTRAAAKKLQDLRAAATTQVQPDPLALIVPRNDAGPAVQRTL